MPQGTDSMLEWVPSAGSVDGSMLKSSPAAPDAGTCTGVLRSHPRTDALMLENWESTMSSAASMPNILRNAELTINMHTSTPPRLHRFRWDLQSGWAKTGDLLICGSARCPTAV